MQATEKPEQVDAREADSPPDVRLDGVRKSFGDVVAVAGVDLEIHRGEFFSLLGPSGSGKTTLLRIIAGFERPDEGSVRLAGVDMTHKPPFERDVNTVFQDYALFPHMTISENVEYGLKVKGVSKQERRRRAEEADPEGRFEEPVGVHAAPPRRRRTGFTKKAYTAPAMIV